jgi:hypothetical protein
MYRFIFVVVFGFLNIKSSLHNKLFNLPARGTCSNGIFTSPPWNLPGGKKKYDKESRERKFLPQWTKDRSWLAYKEYKQLMFCNWCRNHEKQLTQTTPSNFKSDRTYR